MDRQRGRHRAGREAEAVPEQPDDGGEVATEGESPDKEDDEFGMGVESANDPQEMPERGGPT